MYLAVGIGGIIGALLRYYISMWFLSLEYFPLTGTLCINLTGCFLLGYINGKIRDYELPTWLITGITTGIIGSYTTFSTFSSDVIHYINEGFIILALIYIFISSVGGYFSVCTGFYLSTYKKTEV